MQEQGFNMEALLLYQDNMSAMLLETNGRASSLKRTNLFWISLLANTEQHHLFSNPEQHHLFSRNFFQDEGE
jgi:hypothetical protein